MFCPNCGAQTPPNANNCPSCGKVLKTSAAPMPMAGPQQPPAPYTPPAGYQPPQYQPPGYQQPMMPGQGQVPNYLVWSIIVTLCCCLPGGIVSIVYAVQANSKSSAGDLAGAMEAAGKAKTWLLISAIAGAVISIAYFAIMMAAGGMSAMLSGMK